MIFQRPQMLFLLLTVFIPLFYVFPKIKKLKRKKRLSTEKMVDEAIKKNNLPVYDEENVLVEALKFEKEKI